MCGIAGFYSVQNRFTEDDLKAMANVIAHRGPDANGFYFSEGVGLAHQRLSIIDLSDSANQPMYAQSGKHVMVYNGEVYNYDELRREFSISAKTKSDSEIVLEMFDSIGVEAIDWLNGMFAFAVFDTSTSVLTLARDRVGIKPLFYYWDGEHFAFGSELKSIVSIHEISNAKALNREAVNQFLHLGFIPSPQTIYKNIYKLPQGHYLQFDGKDITITPYWEAKSQVSSETITDKIQGKEVLRDLVEQSVRYRLRSDVPFGTFLSGGIDSSLVTAMAQRTANEQIKTFSIGFDDAKHDESAYARSVANYLGTDHHEFRVTEKETQALLPSLLDVYDEPYADTSAFPTMVVSKFAREHVTMTLSGDGGDELFMGYGAYAWATKLSSGMLGSYRNIAGNIASLFSSRYKRVGQLLRYNKNTDFRSHIFSQEQYFFSYDEIALLTGNGNGLTFIDPLEISGREFTPAEQQAYFDLQYYLPDDLLTKVDRASMKYSLESRVPLLDHSIVEFALNLSPELKVKDGVQKYLLKEVLYDYVPATLFDRPKWGFSIPLMRWLKSEFAYLMDDYLSSEIVTKHGIVSDVVVQKLRKRFESGRNDYLYNRIWVLIVLHKFLEEKF